MNNTLIRRAALVLLALLVIGLALALILPAGAAGRVTVVAAPPQATPMRHPDFPLITPPPADVSGVNLALNKPVTASSFTDVYDPGRAVDGDAAGPSYWEAAKDSYPNWLTVDLGSVQTVSSARLRLAPVAVWGSRAQTLSLAVSADDTNYTEVVPTGDFTFDYKTGNTVTMSFAPTRARYVKLTCTGNTGANGCQVAEFEVYAGE